MIGVVIALLGGILWVGLRGDADPSTFLVGATVSLLSAWAARLPLRGRLSPMRLAMGIALCAQILLRFVIDLVVANLRQLRLVLSPRLRVRPRWVRFDVRLKHPVTREVLGVLISLTPGTVTEELRGSELVVHVLNAKPDEDPAAAIRSRLEDPLLRLEGL